MLGQLASLPGLAECLRRSSHVVKDDALTLFQGIRQFSGLVDGLGT